MKANAIGTSLQTQTPRLVALLLLAACALFLFAGCQRQAATPAAAKPVPDVAGTYALVSIDGRPVPGVVHHEDMDMDVKSGSFTFTVDGHCGTRTVVGIKGRPQDAVIDRQATYVQAGAEFTMRWEGFGETKGVLAGNEFTMDNEGMVFVYRK